MKRLEKVTMTILGLVLAINVTTAQPRSGNGPDAGNRNGFMMQGLDLSEDQQIAIKKLHLQMQKEALPIRNSIGENKAKLQTLSTMDQVDMKAINKLIDANSKLQADLAKKMAGTHQEVRKLLTEDQRIIFDSQRLNQRGQRGGQGEGQHMGLQESHTPRAPNGPRAGGPARGN